jgi:hypothetical protein
MTRVHGSGATTPRALCGVLACLLGACGGEASAPPAKPGWTLEGNRARYADPPEKERLKTSRGKPSVDVRTLELSAEGEELRVTATFNDPWEACFDTEALGEVVLELWLDTDANASTGGVLLGGTAKGFEHCLKPIVGPEIDFLETPARVTGYSAGYGLTSFRQDEDEFAASRRATVDDLKTQKARQDESKVFCSVQGAELRFAVPYALLGVHSGQTIRVVVMERYGTVFSADSLFPELTLKLR